MGKAQSLESLDLGFPEDDGENQNDGLCFFICKVFIMSKILF